MNTLIIYAHPNPNSFNYAILQTTVQKLQQKQHEIRIRDLYEMNFNPVLKEDYFTKQNPAVSKAIQEEQMHFSWAKQLIFIYPTWWNGMPAILKGYIDKIFTNGFAFTFTDEGAKGLLQNKRAIIFQTTSHPENYLKPYQLIASMETIVDVGILNFCGIETITHKFFYSVPYVDENTKKAMLKEVEDIVEMI
ncbi:NAD(P)H-dependent oxidoreductase [Aeribacillus pallidus]|uniref:NAD(P)H-dependent oxidoreductase n=1 Tax=Aeribacillus TaxID=1055323 RepID=UPI0007B48913|nr:MULTISPECIES: NAD(P)H-dependent oxidoreductase [Aeribacillus]KZM53736.1 hypothetical protein A3Q35_16235 [Aeribacillus pallidus]MED0650351.1 NAD(P)H-dependent oxidoreductase [Aeribacillus composti]MED4485512.1 NAD(P)H-dependent oxidoreductase [Aeribacillus pallidus]